MSSRGWQIYAVMSAIILAAPAASATDETNRLPRLFGFTIGQKYSPPGRFLTTHEERDYYLYSFESQNPNYMFRSVGVSKRSATIVRIGGTAFHKTSGACETQLAEILAQLNQQYPGLKDKVTRESDATFHLLSRDRPACSVKTTVGGQSLTYSCSIGFSVYCAASGDAYSLHIDASDTAYSEQARLEAATAASRSRRKQLD